MSNHLKANHIQVPNLSVGTLATASYQYFNSSGILEENEPPYAEEMLITGNYTVGSTLTTVIVGLVIPNGQPPGQHVYRWYRGINRQGFNDVLIAGATSSTYVLQEADDGLYIRAEADLRQTNGGNTEGATMYSLYTPVRINSEATYNPIVDILWESAYIPEDLTLFDARLIWINRGTSPANPGNITVDESFPFPAYDATEQALRFERANLERVRVAQALPTQPFEFWIRFKVVALQVQYLYASSSSIFTGINANGTFRISGGNSVGAIAAGTWYVIRVVHNGDGTASLKINNGPAETITNVATLGIGAYGRLGSQFNQMNFLDGWISHHFFKDTPLTPEEETAMWNYFGL